MGQVIGKTSAGGSIEIIDRSNTRGLCAEVWPSDRLYVELELFEDCPGRVQVTFGRSGMSETEMTFEELDRGLSVIRELRDELQRRWPKLCKEVRE